MNFVAVVVAAGRGERLGRPVPKGVVPLGGKPLVRWSAEAFAAHPNRVGVVAVAPPGLVASLEEALEGIDPLRVVEGGERRQDSVRAGLAAAEALEAECDLVHDAARPFVPHDLVDRLLAMLADGSADAVVPGLPPAETMKRVEGTRVVETPPRASLRAIGTPQALLRPRGREAYERLAGGAETFTDCASVVEADGGTVVVVEGDARAFKITTADDLARAEALVAGRE